MPCFHKLSSTRALSARSCIPSEHMERPYATLCNIASTKSAPAERATPPRKTNPPKAQRTQPQTHLALSRPQLPLKTLTLFLTKQSQNRTPLPATSATLPPPHQQHAHPHPHQCPRRLRHAIQFKRQILGVLSDIGWAIHVGQVILRRHIGLVHKEPAGSGREMIRQLHISTHGVVLKVPDRRDFRNRREESVLPRRHLRWRGRQQILNQVIPIVPPPLQFGH